MAEASSTNGKLYTLTEVSKRTKISMPTLQRYKKMFNDRIPSSGDGRSQRYPETAIEIFNQLKVENSKKRGRPRKNAAQGAGPAAPRPAKAAAPKAVAKPAAEEVVEPGMLSLKDVEDQTGISYPTLLRYLKTSLKRIPHKGSGRRRRFPQEAVAVFKTLKEESRRGRKAGSGKAAAAKPAAPPAAKTKAAAAKPAAPAKADKGKDKDMCIERVLLDTTRAGACDLPAVIRALIVADLPAVMFCRNAHLLTIPGVKEASGLADRVVVDMAWHGAECRDVWPRMPEFGNLVSDLAWDRIRGYRGAMAQYFDTPANRDLLKDLRAVQVVTRPERPAPEAAYLLAWILGSLGYQRANGLEWRKADATVRAGFRAMRGDEPDAADSCIHLVDFVGARENLRFTMSARELRITETGDASEIVVPVPAFEPDTALLSDEMMVERRRRTFEQHLGATIRLFEEPVYFADEQPH